MAFSIRIEKGGVGSGQTVGGTGVTSTFGTSLLSAGGGLWIDSIADIGCDAVGLDWTMDIGVARQKVGHKVALQGNIDPTVLFAPPEVIRNEVEKVLASYGFGSGHVFNLGHGISQFTNPDNAAALVAAVHELSRKYH